MTARPSWRLAAVLAFALPGQAACTPAPRPPVAAPEPSYTIPADLCRQLDPSAFAPLWGRPAGTSGERRGRGLRCLLVFPGPRARQPASGGTVTADVAAYPTASDAATAFGRPLPAPTDQSHADQPRYEHRPGYAAAHLREANVLVDVTARADARGARPDRLTAAVATFADQVLRVVRSVG